MAATQINSPFAYFKDLAGLALDNGTLYVGADGADPEVTPKAVFTDEALTAPISQPISVKKGSPVSGTTPVTLYVDGAYSYRTRQVGLEQVDFVPSVAPSILNVLAEDNGSSRIGYMPSGAGAVATTVESKLSEIVSIEDFGGVGDWNGSSGTDNSAALVAAIAAVNVNKGGVINLKPGARYKIASTVAVANVTDANVNLNGNGAELVFTMNGVGLQVDNPFFRVQDVTLTGPTVRTPVTFTGALVAATAGNLTSGWPGATGSYTMRFSDGSERTVTLTNGAATVNWIGAITATASASAWSNTLSVGIDATFYDTAYSNLTVNNFYTGIRGQGSTGSFDRCFFGANFNCVWLEDFTNIISFRDCYYSSSARGIYAPNTSGGIASYVAQILCDSCSFEVNGVDISTTNINRLCLLNGWHEQDTNGSVVAIDTPLLTINTNFVTSQPSLSWIVVTGYNRQRVDIDSFTGVTAGNRNLISSKGIGYMSGTEAGGAVTQATSKTTGVTLNTLSGAITMNGAALAAGAAVSFTVLNSYIEATDVVIVSIKSGATAGAYSVIADAVAVGSFQVSLRNVSGGSLSEAVVINFAIIRGSV